MSSFNQAKAAQAALYAAAKRASDRLATIPGVGSGQMGLTPDAVKFSPAYREARASYQRAADEVRQFNATFTKVFARELREERRQRGR